MMHTLSLNKLSQKITAAVMFSFSLMLLSLSSYAQHSNAEPDYSKQDNWIIRTAGNTPLPVDVFYIYPTVFFDKSPGNMRTDNQELRQKAEGVCTEHCGVYSPYANVFAPFYRQVSIAVLDLDEKKAESYFSIAYGDVKKAFLHFLSEENQGRPFILAGHSQGSEMVLLLMKEFFEDPGIIKNLVAAYIIGYSVTDKDLEECPWLKIASSHDDVGVIVSYNTQSPDATGSPILLADAACVNPLSWTTSLQHAPKTMNAGAVFFDENHQAKPAVKNYTDAQVGENGALIVTEPDPDDYYTPGKSFFPRGVFHAFDYNFFYKNLQENVKTRIAAFQNQE